MIEMKTFAFDKIVFKVIQGESPADRVSFVASGDTKIHRRDSLIYAYSLLPRHLTCVHIACLHPASEAPNFGLTYDIQQL
jgi:hypothetical protein